MDAVLLIGEHGNYEKSEFEQVHYQNVPQRNTDKISKRQRVPESMKFLLGLEEQETCGLP